MLAWSPECCHPHTASCESDLHNNQIKVNLKLGRWKTKKKITCENGNPNIRIYYWRRIQRDKMTFFCNNCILKMYSSLWAIFLMFKYITGNESQSSEGKKPHSSLVDRSSCKNPPSPQDLHTFPSQHTFPLTVSLPRALLGNLQSSERLHNYKNLSWE